MALALRRPTSTDYRGNSPEWTREVEAIEAMMGGRYSAPPPRLVDWNDWRRETVTEDPVIRSCLDPDYLGSRINGDSEPHPNGLPPAPFPGSVRARRRRR